MKVLQLFLVQRGERKTGNPLHKLSTHTPNGSAFPLLKVLCGLLSGGHILYVWSTPMNAAVSMI